MAAGLCLTLGPGWIVETWELLFGSCSSVMQGRQKRSGCSGYGQTSFSQGRNESPFLQIVSTKQKI